MAVVVLECSVPDSFGISLIYTLIFHFSIVRNLLIKARTDRVEENAQNVAPTPGERLSCFIGGPT